MSDSTEAAARSLHTRVTVALCFLAAMCEGFDVQAAGVAGPGLRAEFSPSDGWLALFFASSGAGLLLGAIAGGRIADRIGRKPVLVVSLATFGLFALFTTLAGDMRALTAIRFMTGLGLGGAMPNLIALTADVTASRMRNAGIALTFIGMPLGAVVSGLIASAIPLDAWRVIFICGGIAPLVVAPLLIRFLPHGQFGSQAGARAAPVLHNPLQELFGGGRASITLLIWLGFLLIVLTLHLLLNWLPLLMMRKGLSGSFAGISQAAFNVGGSLVTLSVGALLDSKWRRPAIAASVVALPVILVALAQAHGSAGPMIALVFFLGGAILAQQIILYAVASASFPAEIRGTVLGAAIAVGRVGSLIGPLFAGWLIASGRSPAQVLTGLLPIVITCGLCVVLLGWRRSSAERTSA
ncbi:MAG: MFS transporter [Steroidobacteraceae bacterium]